MGAWRERKSAEIPEPDAHAPSGTVPTMHRTSGGLVQAHLVPALPTQCGLETGRGWEASPEEAATPEDLRLDAAIQRHIARVLEATRGNKLRAAALLGIGRSTLYRLLASAPAGEVETIARS
jgi:DNA-binding NtrC family response regulator